MLEFDLEDNQKKDWIICIHGYKGNKNSMKQIVSSVSNFNKLFLQAPFEISKNEYSWHNPEDQSLQLSKESFLETLDYLHINLDNSIWLGFSQGGVVVFELASDLNLQRIGLICSFVKTPLPNTFQAKTLFWYSSKNDPIISYDESFKSFMDVEKKFKNSLFNSGFSEHKISSFGLKVLKHWLDNQATLH